MENNLRKILTEASSTLGIHLKDRELILFSHYFRELLLWNKKINLVSVTSDLDIPIKHFIDSLIPVPFLKNKEAKLLDIGSGAGFPGLPIKIAVPSLKVFLLEASRKKTSFLKHVIRTLHLDDITVIHNRAEHLMADSVYKDYFDIIISRATLKISELLWMGSYFLKNDGFVIAMKGKNIVNEWDDRKDISGQPVLTFLSCHEIQLPVMGDLRKIVIFKKTVSPY
jgi:16S rRNA (guanine527-N7)-methyltransferase